jgi:hypothetical protein
MNAMKNNCLGFLILYCCVFTWMAVPFVMADDALLRQPDLVPGNSAESIIPRETVTAAIDMRDLQEKIIDDVKKVSVD